jgi:hypothetical protein
MKKYLIFFILIISFAFISCSYDSAALEEKNRQERDEKREHIMEQMELRLKSKYAMGSFDEQPFDVYDLSKGQNKAWFQYGLYPAKAVSYMLEEESEEFQVQIETDGKKFGTFEDNYYGILYGEKVREELSDMLAQYPLEDVEITYQPCEDIPREDSDLKKHIMVWGKIHVSEPNEIDILCELADKLNSMGCQHRIHIYNDIKGDSAMGRNNISSKEIRDYFK